jgi:hypothetical protein
MPRRGEVKTSLPAKFKAKLLPRNTEAVVERRGTIRPTSPKVPFEHPTKAVETSDTGQSRLPQGDPAGQGLRLAAHGLRVAGHGMRMVRRGLRVAAHDLRVFFRHRRRGRARIVNYIVLPAATLVVFIIILALFKFR